MHNNLRYNEAVQGLQCTDEWMVSLQKFKTAINTYSYSKTSTVDFSLNSTLLTHFKCIFPTTFFIENDECNRV